MQKEITTNEIMDFLVENMATKADIAQLRSETKADIAQLRSEMATKDDIRNMATKDDIEDLRTEMTAGFRVVRQELDETKQELTKLVQRTLEDTDALAANVIDLQQRVGVLEQKEKIKS